MARPRSIDPKLVEHAQWLAARARMLEELWCTQQAVLLPALLNATLEQTAAAPGVGRATVGRYQTKVRRPLSHPTEPPPQWGGRRSASMRWEEELEFLRPWAEQAADGGMLIVAPLRAALAQRLGHPVAHSVVYRLLARHGWRKVAPDTRHPKSNPAAQERWKKTPPRAGGHPPPHSGARTAASSDVPGRGTLRAHGAHSPPLGAGSQAADGVCNGFEREFVYVYEAVSPLQGQPDSMITRQMNTARMSEFLAQVSAAHANEFIVMVVDGARVPLEREQGKRSDGCSSEAA